MRDTGTPVSVARWARTLAVHEASALELHAMDATGAQLVTSWTGTEVLADVERWSAVVSELATEDAQARGVTTRYELRHRRDERTLGVTHLRRVIAQVDDERGADGSTLGLVAQLQRALHQSHQQLLEASRAAVQAQQASMVLLGQAYQHIGTLQTRTIEQHEAIVSAAPAPEKPDMVRSMLEVVGPHIAQEVAVRLLSGASGGGTPPSTGA